MFRFGVRYARTLGALGTFSMASMLAAAVCDAPTSWDTRGMPKTVALGPTDKSSPMELVGVGMRSKNFYITSVNVYLCGLSLSKDQIARTIAWHTGGRKATSSLTEHLLTPGTKAGPQLTVALRFVRGVTTAQVVEAFNDAFRGLPEIEIADFKKELSATIGGAGLKEKEEIAFWWSSPTGFTITKNGQPTTTFKSGVVTDRLLAVYLDPSMTICPELIASVDKNLADNNV